MTRSLTTALIAAGLIFAGGCQAEKPSPDHFAGLNAALVDVLNRSAIDEAIIAQHTIYPYHFIRHSAELNNLGRRDLSVLLSHYQTYPAASQPLTVRRGDTPEELYDARMEHLMRAIAEAGISADNLVVSDGMPGGDGAASDRVIRILEVDRQATTAGGTGMSTGGIAR